MGGCASAPAGRGVGSSGSKSGSGAAVAGAAVAPPSSPSGASGRSPLPAAAQKVETIIETIGAARGSLQLARAVLDRIAAVQPRGSARDTMAAVAEELRDALGVEAASLIACANGGAECPMLLEAAAGAQASVLLTNAEVMLGPAWSPRLVGGDGKRCRVDVARARVRDGLPALSAGGCTAGGSSHGGSSSGGGLFMCTAPFELLDADGAALPLSLSPRDWVVLAAAGCQAFVVVRVSGADGAMLGALGLASTRRDAFDDPGLIAALELVAAGGVGQLLSLSKTRALAALAAELFAHSSDFAAFAAAFLHGTQRVVAGAAGQQVDVRLGLLSPDGRTVALLHAGEGAAGEAAGEGAGAECALVDAAGTLLADVVAEQRARVVCDAATACIDAGAEPPADLFFGAAGATTAAPGRSVAVVPLGRFGLAAPSLQGALYASCGDAAGAPLGRPPVINALRGAGALLRNLLQLGFVVVPGGLWTEQRGSAARRRSAPAAVVAGSSGDLLAVVRDGVRRHVAERRFSLDALRQAAAAEAAAAAAAAAGSGSPFAPAAPPLLDLQLQTPLGRGGFGTCWSARWRGALCAAKVVPITRSHGVVGGAAPGGAAAAAQVAAGAVDDARADARLAMEIATMMEVSHPNIVKVFECVPNVVVVGDAANPGVLSVRLATPQDASARMSTLVLMELCRAGNLADAVLRGRLLHHKHAPSGGLAVNMRLLVAVLLDVVAALEHLHALGLVHCDVKLENLLLQPCGSAGKRFAVKLADFGLVRLAPDGHDAVVNRTLAGTASYLAPECLNAEAPLSRAVDVYAVGILMYELYSRQRAFEGAPPLDVMCGVAAGLRPCFPANAPPRLVALARACWHTDPARRPSIGEVGRLLRVVLPPPPPTGP